MTDERLTGILAERIMGWRLGADRFLMPSRGWTPKWKFRPTERRTDALRLLDAAEHTEYALSTLPGRRFKARIRIGERVGTAEDAFEARAICCAMARAIGVEPDERKPAKTGADRQ